MKIAVSRAHYKGLASITAETTLFRLEAIPEIGGKIVSLKNKKTDKEWLIDSGNRPLMRPRYGSSFINADMSGWDECFPTIDETRLRYGFREVTLPDHGEIWSLPWNVEIRERFIEMSVKGIALPYQFKKKISFLNETSLRVDYEMTNFGNHPLPFLWAAHPQFNVNEETEIVLPKEMKKVLCVHGGKNFTEHTVYSWPIKVPGFKKTGMVNRVFPEVNGDARKFYNPGAVPVGWSGLYGRESQNFLILRVPASDVPFLGIWIDEGKFNDRVTCALEPCIGYYDSLQAAINNYTAGKVEPGKRKTWHLEIIAGKGTVGNMYELAECCGGG